eukprot:EG_transcript_4335
MATPLPIGVRGPLPSPPPAGSLPTEQPAAGPGLPVASHHQPEAVMVHNPYSFGGPCEAALARLTLLTLETSLGHELQSGFSNMAPLTQQCNYYKQTSAIPEHSHFPTTIALSDGLSLPHAIFVPEVLPLTLPLEAVRLFGGQQSHQAARTSAPGNKAGREAAAIQSQRRRKQRSNLSVPPDQVQRSATPTLPRTSSSSSSSGSTAKQPPFQERRIRQCLAALRKNSTKCCDVAQISIACLLVCTLSGPRRLRRGTPGRVPHASRYCRPLSSRPLAGGQLRHEGGLTQHYQNGP